MFRSHISLLIHERSPSVLHLDLRRLFPPPSSYGSPSCLSRVNAGPMDESMGRAGQFEPEVVQLVPHLPRHIFHFSRLIPTSRARIHEGIMVVCKVVCRLQASLLFLFGEHSQMLQEWGHTLHEHRWRACIYICVCVHTLRPISLHCIGAYAGVNRLMRWVPVSWLSWLCSHGAVCRVTVTPFG
jgi:hypothetical protein